MSFCAAPLYLAFTSNWMSVNKSTRSWSLFFFLFCSIRTIHKTYDYDIISASRGGTWYPASRYLRIIYKYNICSNKITHRFIGHRSTFSLRLLQLLILRWWLNGGGGICPSQVTITAQTFWKKNYLCF